MHAIELLTQRQSTPLLAEPMPSQEHLDTILSAGMRVPDHAGLVPWQFTLVSSERLNKLSEIFVNAVTKQGADQAKIDKTAKMPFRAPLIIVVSTRYQVHDKVPKQEQVVAAGCATHAMQMAAFSLGYGAMWRTGDLAYNEDVKAGLAIDDKDEIIGFLYIGTPQKSSINKPQKAYDPVVRYL